MIATRMRQLFTSMRQGINNGFVSGLVILFLILIGIPIRIPSLGLFSLLLVVAIFAVRLARHLQEERHEYLLLNALALGIAAAVVAFLFMSLINRWQARGIDVKQYFDAITTETMTVLSGVPEAELHPNPEIDPLTGEYPEGEPLRTDPMRLTFDSDTGLHLKLGLTGDAWVDVNLIIGGFYGFMLLLVIVAALAAGLTRLASYAELGRYRKQTGGYLAGHPVAHWVILFLPLLSFALLWLTKGQSGNDPILSLGGSRQEIQLLLGFLIILCSLVALRSAQPVDWGLGYTLRVALSAGGAVLVVLLAIWRITGNNVYFIAPGSEPSGSETLSILAVVIVGIIMVAQNALALHRPERLEFQVAGTLALGVVLIMPLYLDQYQSDVMTLVGINIMLGLGLNIVVGYAGLLDLGYVAFFALGAYAYAFLSSNQMIQDENNQPKELKFAGNDEMVIKIAAWVGTTVIVAAVVVALGLYLWRRSQAAQRTQSRTLLHLPARPPGGTTLLLAVIAITASLLVSMALDGSGLYKDIFGGVPPFLIGLLAGILVAGLSGIALGIPVLRLRGDYLAIVTLGFGEIIRLLFNNLRDYTGGPQGVLQIPRPLPEGATGSVTYLSILYLVFMGAGVVAFFSLRLRQSRTGRAWSAMKSDEDIAQSMGVNLVQSKLTAFAIGAAFAGIGGVLFAARQRNIFPNDFKLDVSIEVLSLVIIGGMGSIPGVIMGAIALIGVPEVLRELATYRILVFGALLVTMVIIRPSGLLPEPPTQLGDRARAMVGSGNPQQEEGTS
jgi:ABC-type branched-subunit amino acid transport system permease subunit